jgi:short subunit dehydrogenase-like uncharacterized protein
MSRALMIYGATGYTGKLLAHAAADYDLQPVLAGRDAAKLRAVAEPLGLRHRVVRVDDVGRQAEALRDVHVLLNAAGPYAATAGSWVDACLRTGTHYLDVAGELTVFGAIERRDAEAREEGVMLMPGAGFVVVASDCLAAHVAERLPGADRLRIGTSRSLFLSRGSAKTMIALVADAVAVRRDGLLTSVPIGAVEHEFDYGYGRRRSTAMSMPELVTAFRTTGIGNIEAYIEVNAVERAAFRLAARWAWLVRNPLCQIALLTQTELLPDGPSGDDRAHGARAVVVEAEDRTGRTVGARVVTPDAYRFTAATALTIAARVLRDELQPGFRTPAQAYGADFVLGLEGVRREDART